MTMQPLKAPVKNGRLVLDEPTDLPEGEVVYLGPVAPESAPLDTVPESEEERQMVADAKAEYARSGVSFSGEQVSALVEARLRRQQAR